MFHEEQFSSSNEIWFFFQAQQFNEFLNFQSKKTFSIHLGRYLFSVMNLPFSLHLTIRRKIFSCNFLIRNCYLNKKKMLLSKVLRQLQKKRNLIFLKSKL